jgi:hypothetical protein
MKNNDLLKFETLFLSLVTCCDGAKKKDGSGFSRADVQDGMRLGSIIKRNLPINSSELMRSRELIKKYRSQISRNLSSDKDEQDWIQKNIQINIDTINPTKFKHDREDIKNYAYLSNQKKFIYLEVDVDSYNPYLTNEIKKISQFYYGQRKVKVFFQKNIKLKRLGNDIKINRWHISYLPITKKETIKICKSNNILISPEIFNSFSSIESKLLKYDAFVTSEWMVRNKKRGQYFVINFNSKNENFIDDVKNNAEYFSCRREDDWNWCLLKTRKNTEFIKYVIEKYNIVPSRGVQNILS